MFFKNLMGRVLREEGGQATGECHCFKPVNIFIKFSKGKINLNYVVRLIFIWGGGARGVLWVGFWSGKAKKNVFYNGLFKIMRKQTALHNNEKGCLCWRPCSVSEEDCVSWRQVLN